jgi:hypothetical protein
MHTELIRSLCVFYLEKISKCQEGRRHDVLIIVIIECHKENQHDSLLSCYLKCDFPKVKHILRGNGLRVYLCWPDRQ